MTAGAYGVKRFRRIDRSRALLITTVPLIRNADKRGCASGRNGSSVVGSDVRRKGAGRRDTLQGPSNFLKPDVSSPEKFAKDALLAAGRIRCFGLPARGATVGTQLHESDRSAGREGTKRFGTCTFSNDGVETVRVVARTEEPTSASRNRARFSQGKPATPWRDRFPKSLALTTDFRVWHRNDDLAGRPRVSVERRRIADRLRGKRRVHTCLRARRGSSAVPSGLSADHWRCRRAESLSRLSRLRRSGQQSLAGSAAPIPPAGRAIDANDEQLATAILIARARGSAAAH